MHPNSRNRDGQFTALPGTWFPRLLFVTITFMFKPFSE